MSLRLFPEIEPPSGRCSSCWLRSARRTIDLNAAMPGRPGRLDDDRVGPAGGRDAADDVGRSLYGSTLESGIGRTSRTWYFAEGATNVFILFYLLENPGDTPATVTLTHLVEGSAAPIRTGCRATVHAPHRPRERRAWTLICRASDHRHLGRANRRRAGDVSELGRTACGRAGTAGRGAIAPEHVVVVRRRGDGILPRLCAARESRHQRSHRDGELSVSDRDDAHQDVRRSRRSHDARSTSTWTIPELASTAMAMSVTSTLPIVAERAMWWEGFPWTEGSAVIGATATGA